MIDIELRKYALEMAFRLSDAGSFPLSFDALRKVALEIENFLLEETYEEEEND